MTLYTRDAFWQELTHSVKSFVWNRIRPQVWDSCLPPSPHKFTHIRIVFFPPVQYIFLWGAQVLTLAGISHGFIALRNKQPQNFTQQPSRWICRPPPWEHRGTLCWAGEGDIFKHNSKSFSLIWDTERLVDYFPCTPKRAGAPYYSPQKQSKGIPTQ